MTPSRHKDSSFQDFDIRLANGARLTGLHHVPAHTTATTPRNVPLIVGVHGGTMTSHYYDYQKDYSASDFSVATGIPFVAINRPCYLASSSILPLETQNSQSETFFQKTAQWMHDFILPALWETFGRPNNCTGIVTMNHSMAVPIAIVTASLFAQDASPKYSLAGIIISGFGSQWADPVELRRPPGTPLPVANIIYPDEISKKLLLGADHFRCYEPEALGGLHSQSVPMPVEELVDLLVHWPTYFADRAREVTVPVICALGEHDFLWTASRETMNDFAVPFTHCPRFDNSVVLGAPHALEWSKMRKGWYGRCFGWAAEVCA